MNIGERLNRYLARIGCTAKELAAAAGVSEVQLSRWRTGKQAPAAEQAALLAAGIVALLPEADEESVRDALIASLAESAVDSDRIIRNLNSLTAALNLRSSALARELPPNFTTVFIFLFCSLPGLSLFRKRRIFARFYFIPGPLYLSMPQTCKTSSCTRKCTSIPAKGIP